MKKQRSKKGYTLIELLCALAIVLLVSTVAINCLQLGLRSYRSIVRESEAQLLCSTLSTAVNEELRFARGASVTDGETVYTDSRGRLSGFSQDENGHVLLRDAPLLSERSYPLGLQAAVELDYDAASALISARVSVSCDGDTLTQNSFSVAPVNLG